MRHLLLGRKAMTNLDSTLKSRDISLLTKVRLVKAVVSSVVTCGCESESQLLGRSVRSLGTPRRRRGSVVLEEEIGIWNSQGGGKDKLFFPLHSLVLAT